MILSHTCTDRGMAVSEKSIQDMEKHSVIGFFIGL